MGKDTRATKQIQQRCPSLAGMLRGATRTQAVCCQAVCSLFCFRHTAPSTTPRPPAPPPRTLPRYAWGSNAAGQCGLGTDRFVATDATLPHLVDDMSSCDIAQVSAGGLATLIVTKGTRHSVAALEETDPERARMLATLEKTLRSQHRMRLARASKRACANRIKTPATTVAGKAPVRSTTSADARRAHAQRTLEMRASEAGYLPDGAFPANSRVCA